VKEFLFLFFSLMRKDAKDLVGVVGSWPASVDWGHRWEGGTARTAGGTVNE